MDQHGIVVGYDRAHHDHWSESHREGRGGRVDDRGSRQIEFQADVRALLVIDHQGIVGIEIEGQGHRRHRGPRGVHGIGRHRLPIDVDVDDREAQVDGDRSRLVGAGGKGGRLQQLGDIDDLGEVRLLRDAQQRECVAVSARERDRVDRDDEARETAVRHGHPHDRGTVAELGLAAGADQEEERAGEEGAQNEHCAKSQATAVNWHAGKPFRWRSGPPAHLRFKTAQF